MKILIDRGHGRETNGKCSPLFDADMQARYGIERLHEWEYCDNVAREVQKRLCEQGFDAILVTPETSDIGLGERVNRINRYCSKYGARNCVAVSIHLNAAGSIGKWLNATGYTGWIAKDASTRSEKLADIFAGKARELDMMGNRKCGPTIKANFVIVHYSKCPAILTESAFQDCKEEVKWLLSDEGFDTMVRLHVESIVEYVQTIK